MPNKSADVIVVGGGPAGTVAGVALAAAGLEVLVLEAEPALATDLRASTIHPPTLDYLATLGLAQELEPIGLRAPEYRYFKRRTGDYISFDMGELADISAYPYRLQCEQWKLTAKAAARLGDRLLTGRRAADAQQDRDGVTLSVETAAGPETYRGRYVVACDGAGSTLRRLLGVEFDGFTYEEKFVCFSTTAPLESWLPDACHVNYMADPEEWLVLLRAPTAWRILVPAALEIADEALLSDVNKDRVFARLLQNDEPIVTLHRTIYRVHQRVAKRYVNGRIILVGDAAHLNNPIGGLGMNSALHDVRNLADKLRLIMREGGEPEPLLGLFERQRRTVMHEFIQAQSIHNKQMMERSPEEGFDRHEAELRATAGDPVLRRRYLLRQSMYSSVTREGEIA